MRNFTPTQRLGIITTDRNLLMSAGAGAGKTATLVERIFHLLTMRPRPCSLDDLLVVTFSRAAAQEMRTRLVERIHDAIADPSTDSITRDHLTEQMTALPRATISTIHSFCLGVISSHPDKAGLAPGFDLMSQEEERLYRRDFLSAKVEEMLAGEERPCLIALLEQFDALSGIDTLLNHITGFHGFLSAIPDPEKFCEDAVELVRPGPDGKISPIAMSLIDDFLTRRFARIEALLAPTMAHTPAALHTSLHAQLEHMRAIASHVAADNSMKCCDRLDALLGMIKFPRLASPRGGYDGADAKFRKLRDHIKDEFTSLCRTLDSFNPDALESDFFACGDTLTFFLRTIGLQWYTELFAQHMKDRRLTFSHLERLAMRILTATDGAPTAVAHAYQKQFRQVLVDEFQDVNELQLRILRSLARPATPDVGGNFFAVGDVKQSIYEFRQADSSLFLGMYDHSKPLQPTDTAPVDSRINLRENFRSHPLLLDELNKIFSVLFTKQTVGIDYEEEQSLVSGRPAIDRARPARFSFEILPKKPFIAGDPWDDEITAESCRVATLVAEIGPPWKDICILLRSTVGSAGDLVEALRRKNIPVHTDSRAGFLTAIEVIEFQALLKAINNPFDDVSLLGMLRGPAMRWSEEDLLNLRDINREALFIENLDEAAATHNAALGEKALEALRALHRWQDLAARFSMQEFFGLLFDDLNLLEQASVRPGGNQRRLNLLQLLDHARQFDSFMRKGLGQFLRFLDDLIDNDEDFSPPSPLAPTADVVRIMSVHKSKGMQFPVVIFPFLGRKFNATNLNQPFLFDRRFGAATTIRDVKTELEHHPALYHMLRDQRLHHERAEELRLLYVAMTRAEESLHLIASVDDPAAIVDQLRCDLAAGHRPEIMDAISPLDWLLNVALSRFTELSPCDGGQSAVDGIASFHVRADVLLGTERTDKTDSREDAADDLQVYQAAMQRAMKLHDAQVRPSLRAKISVSEAKRAFDASRDSNTPAYQPPRAPSAAKAVDWFPLKDGGFAREQTGLTRGKATHRFLANCDLVGLAFGRTKLADELHRLTGEGFLEPDDQKLINLQEIAWFLNSDLGRRLTKTVGRNLREKPFICRIDAKELSAPTQAGFLILQGVIDLLFKTEAGWILIDYKTDYCGENGERIPDLRESYTAQLQLYRVLVERTLREPVAETWLVFLQARQYFEIPTKELSLIKWESVIQSGALVLPESTGRAARTTRV